MTKDIKKERKSEENLKSNKQESIYIKPHFISFMFFYSGLIIWLIIILVFWLTALITLNIYVFIMSFFFLFAFLISFFLTKVKYNKEKYTLTDRKIIHESGSLFSDNSAEIDLDKIVQVKETLPFIQNILFKTGNIQIKTAGSSNSTITFKSINIPKKLYDIIKLRMMKNGFSLKMDKLVQTEKPHFLAIIGEIFGKSLGAILFTIYFIYSFYVGFQEEGGNIDDISEDVVTGGIGFIIFIIIIIVPFIIFKYLDLRKRRYKVFTDSVTYNEGFLTKHYSFLPMENISDTENTQGFFSKIFGLHDVVVSSIGNNNKVIFKNMLNGEKMMENIKYLKDKIILGEKDLVEVENTKDKNSLLLSKNTMEEALDYDREYISEFKISKMRTLFPLLILLIPPFTPAFFVIGAYTLIQIIFTKFIIGKTSIEKRFQFISTKHNSFSIEKISGVVIRESLIDKLFKTCSIKFWSIGSGSDITFKNIKKIPNLEENILAKLGIKKKKIQKNIDSRITFLDYIKSKIGIFIIYVSSYIGLILLNQILKWAVDGYTFNNESNIELNITIVYGLIFIIFLIRYLYKKFYYSPVRYINKIYAHSIESIEGFFIVTKKYSLFRNIKGNKARKYPLTNTGTLIFDIAGEQITEQKGTQTNGILILAKLLSGKGGGISIASNKIKINFIRDVFETFDLNEEIINKKAVKKESLAHSKQDIGNSIFVYVIILIVIIIGSYFVINAVISGIDDNRITGLFMLTLIPIIPVLITIGFVTWSIKVRLYDYQKDRILFSSGIIYKQKHSILYKKFNYVEFNKGFINKIFKNGNISIYTLGSGGIDLLIKDIPNYKEVHEMFKKD